MARPPQRVSIFPHRQLPLLLHPTHDPHLYVLRSHLDQGMEKNYPIRHQGRSDGADAAEVQSESSQDARGRSHPVCAILAAIVRHLRKDQVRRRDRDVGGRNPAHRHPHSAVVGSFQLLHQPHSVRIL